jgi:hypothetical protein
MAPPPRTLQALRTAVLVLALEDLKANAKRSGAKLRKAPRGFSAWVDPQRPTSVHLARPGAPYQVEVYDPDPKRALHVALPGELRLAS